MYEVQFRDGFGAWRRWSYHRTREAADRSYARLLKHFGSVPALTSLCRIVER